MDFLAVGVFQACGMGGKSLLFAVLRKIVLEIPATDADIYLSALYKQKTKEIQAGRTV